MNRYFKPELTDEQKKKIKELYLSETEPVGVSTIAVRLRLSGSRIQNYLKAEGIKRDPSEALKLKREKKIVYHESCSFKSRNEKWGNGNRTSKDSF